MSWITAVSLSELEHATNGRFAWVVPRTVTLFKLAVSSVLRYWFCLKLAVPISMLAFFRNVLASCTNTVLGANLVDTLN